MIIDYLTQCYCKVSYNAFKERLERDKTPKSLFVEMDVLKEDVWQEQARWIKFEEDLMEGADRWGNPHVSSLSFHSLINLRLVLERCEASFEAFTNRKP